MPPGVCINRLHADASSSRSHGCAVRLRSRASRINGSSCLASERRSTAKASEQELDAIAPWRSTYEFGLTAGCEASQCQRIRTFPARKVGFVFNLKAECRSKVKKFSARGGGPHPSTGFFPARANLRARPRGSFLFRSPRLRSFAPWPAKREDPPGIVPIFSKPAPLSARLSTH